VCCSSLPKQSRVSNANSSTTQHTEPPLTPATSVHETQIRRTHPHYTNPRDKSHGRKRGESPERAHQIQPRQTLSAHTEQRAKQTKKLAARQIHQARRGGRYERTVFRGTVGESTERDDPIERGEKRDRKRRIALTSSCDLLGRAAAEAGGGGSRQWGARVLWEEGWGEGEGWCRETKQGTEEGPPDQRDGVAGRNGPDVQRPSRVPGGARSTMKLGKAMDTWPVIRWVFLLLGRGFGSDFISICLLLE
jgi:hypothetical protein